MVCPWIRIQDWMTYWTIGSYRWTHSVFVKHILLHISCSGAARVRVLHFWAVYANACIYIGVNVFISGTYIFKLIHRYICVCIQSSAEYFGLTIICTFIYICLYVCRYTYMHIMYICMWICTSIHMCDWLVGYEESGGCFRICAMCEHVRECIHMYVYIHVCMHTCVYIVVCMRL